MSVLAAVPRRSRPGLRAAFPFRLRRWTAISNCQTLVVSTIDKKSYRRLDLIHGATTSPWVCSAGRGRPTAPPE